MVYHQCYFALALWLRFKVIFFVCATDISIRIGTSITKLSQFGDIDFKYVLQHFR